MFVKLCLCVDLKGKIKYLPNKFKPSEDDVCVTSYETSYVDGCKKTLFYNLLDYNEEFIIDTCWTQKETIRRCKEQNCLNVKIFTRVQDFFDVANELNVALLDDLGDDFDEEIDVLELREFCKQCEREFLGERDGIKFFRYKVLEMEEEI